MRAGSRSLVREMAGSVDEILERALALGDEGQWDDMARVLGEALETWSDDPYLLCWLGVAEQELGNDGAAYDYFRRCLAEEPLDPHLLALAGAGLAAFDDPDAEAALRAAALTGPDVPMARLQYGAYLARAGMFDEALEQLRAALELSPEDPVVHGEYATALALKGETAEAAAAMERALELAPDDSWTRLLLGLLYVELGSMEEAAEALIQAAEEIDGDAEADVLAALAAAAVGWDDAAQDAIARAPYAAEGVEEALIAEAEERINTGPAAARSFLVKTLAPSVLRERLAEPL